jgi:hypothetical protein
VVYRVLVGKPERKRPLGRPRRRWEDNIKMDLQEVAFGGMYWIELTLYRDRWRALVGTLVIAVYFNIRNTLPNFGTFLLGRSVYVCMYMCVCVCLCVST